MGRAQQLSGLPDRRLLIYIFKLHTNFCILTPSHITIVFNRLHTYSVVAACDTIIPLIVDGLNDVSPSIDWKVEVGISFRVVSGVLLHRVVGDWRDLMRHESRVVEHPSQHLLLIVEAFRRFQSCHRAGHRSIGEAQHLHGQFVLDVTHVKDRLG